MTSQTETVLQCGPGVKVVIARIALGFSIILFLVGQLLLCFCPGWYAVAAVSAGVSAILGGKRIRFWGTLLFLVSIAFTIMHRELELKDNEFWRKVRLDAQLRLQSAK
jgi:hypothetical protein